MCSRLVLFQLKIIAYCPFTLSIEVEKIVFLFSLTSVGRNSWRSIKNFIVGQIAQNHQVWTWTKSVSSPNQDLVEITRTGEKSSNLSFTFHENVYRLRTSSKFATTRGIVSGLPCGYRASRLSCPPSTVRRPPQTRGSFSCGSRCAIFIFRDRRASVLAVRIKSRDVAFIAFELFPSVFFIARIRGRRGHHVYRSSVWRLSAVRIFAVFFFSWAYRNRQWYICRL